MAPLFPLVFAAIVGRLFYQVSHWRLKKGVSLNTLEQLMGSRTLGAALMTHFQLKIYNGITLAILLIWTLSPLGGQSLLRVLSARSRPIPTTATYFNTYNAHTFNSFGSDNSLYMAAIQAHQEVLDGPRDLWGNMKVPFLDIDSAGESDGWLNVTANSASDYSGLFGIPVKDMPSGNTTFVMESDYIQLHCSPFVATPYNETNRTGIASATVKIKDLPEEVFNLPEDEALDHLIANGTWSNGTWYGSPQLLERNAHFALAIDRFSTQMTIYAAWNLSRANFGPTHLLFQAAHPSVLLRVDSRPSSVRSECRVLKRYIESRVICSKSANESRSTCSILSQKLSSKERPNENLSILNFAGMFHDISAYLPRVKGGNYDPGIIPYGFLFDTNGAPTRIEDVLNTTIHNFERRLSQLLNSFILVHHRTYKTTPDDGPVVLESDNDGPVPIEFEGNPYNSWTTTASETSGGHFIYNISTAWMSISLASCTVLFLSGVISGLFNHLNTTPELLGYVSTTLRDSRFIDIQSSLNSLTGAEVSLLMKEMRLRYGIYQSLEEGSMDEQMGIGREEDIKEIRKGG